MKKVPNDKSMREDEILIVNKYILIYFNQSVLDSVNYTTKVYLK